MELLGQLKNELAHFRHNAAGAFSRGERERKSLAASLHRIPSCLTTEPAMLDYQPRLPGWSWSPRLSALDLILFVFSQASDTDPKPLYTGSAVQAAHHAQTYCLI